MLRRIRRLIKGHPTSSKAPGQTVGVLAIMKNESMILREWVDHYRWQGVDRIFLIDNGSEDDPRPILKDDITSGFVELFERPQRHRQKYHYREVFRTARIRSKVEWLVMADLDEFWFSPMGNLKKAIATVQAHFDLIYANWVMFGSSGLIEQPPSVRESFIYRWSQLGDHRNTKWICRTYRMVGRHAIDLHKVKGIDSRRVVFDNDVFRLNHYPIQSLQFFQRVKMTRGSANTSKFDNIRDMEYFKAYDRPATVLDTQLADMVRAQGTNDV